MTNFSCGEKEVWLVYVLNFMKQKLGNRLFVVTQFKKKWQPKPNACTAKASLHTFYTLGKMEKEKFAMRVRIGDFQLTSLCILFGGKSCFHRL